MGLIAADFNLSIARNFKKVFTRLNFCCAVSLLQCVRLRPLI